MLGLRYPGGPEIERMAEGAPETEPFPRAWMRGTDDFSFSGLKTAVINRARSLGIYPPREDTGPASRGVDPEVVAGMARAFQDSVVDVLVTKTVAAAVREDCAGIVLVGGVAANGPLRETLVAKSPLPVAIPPIKLCTDNGAMIAMSGLVNYRNGRRDDWQLDVIPNLRIGAGRSAPGVSVSSGRRRTTWSHLCGSAGHTRARAREAHLPDDRREQVALCSSAGRARAF